MSSTINCRRPQLVLQLLHRRQQRCKEIEDQEQTAQHERTRQLYLDVARLQSSLRQLEDLLAECDRQVAASITQYMLWHGIRPEEPL